MTDTSKNQNLADKQSLGALRQHGEKIIYAVLVVLAVFFGWQYYQNNYAKVDTVAADLYTNIAVMDENLMQAEINEPGQNASQQEALFADIDQLVAAHGDTVYAWQALMIKARHQAANDDLAGAVTTLNQASAISGIDEGMLAITKLRYARAMLANNDIDGAMAIANEPMPSAFEASRQELLGDVYLAQNNTESAKGAYGAAWEVLRQRQENRAVLALKLQSLGVTVEPIDLPAVVVQPTAQDAAAVDVQPEADIEDISQPADAPAQ